MDLRAEPAALPGRPELHFPYLGGKSTHLHLAWANPGRSVQGTMVSSQSTPREPRLTRSTWSTAVPEGPRSRGSKRQRDCPIPPQKPLSQPRGWGGPFSQCPRPGSKCLSWEQGWAGPGRQRAPEGGSCSFLPGSRLPSTPMPHGDSP